MTPYFEINDNRFIATPYCAGPWDKTLLHGGAPAALITHLIDALPSETPMLTTRLNIDLKRPAPVGPISADLQVTRQGRNIQNVEVVLSANGKEVAKASALKIRKADIKIGNDIDNSRQPPARSHQSLDSFFGFPVPFVDEAQIFEAKTVPELMDSAFWFHFGRPFFADLPTTPLMRAAATGDFCNALSLNPLFEKFTFLNADLTLHFAREPVGEWMMLAAKALVSDEGRALAYGDLADEQGYFGRTVQSLVIAER